MNLFRNPEVKRTLFFLLLLGSLTTLSCFFLHKTAGLLTGISFVCVLLCYLLETRKRYRRLSDLAAGIDSILHGNETFPLSQYKEGELSLLQSELTKLTVRLREQAELLKTDKLRLADSIADISHQIRTPLTSIHLLLEAMREENLPEEARLSKLFEIRKLLSRIDWLISALLKIARLDAGTVQFKQEEVSLSELIAKSLAPLLIPMEVKEQTLEQSVSGYFTGDLSWTAEAIGNILKNCIEHMEAGTLFITARENPLYSEIIIRDTGSGFAAEDIPYLFDRFYKGKNATDTSIGIGLSLSRMIITAQNGTVKAENYRDGGAMFTIRFYKTII